MCYFVGRWPGKGVLNTSMYLFMLHITLGIFYRHIRLYCVLLCKHAPKDNFNIKTHVVTTPHFFQRFFTSGYLHRFNHVVPGVPPV